jgi:potassium/hydrogen antiporter
VTIEQFNLGLLGGALVVLVAIAAVRLAVGTGLPSLLLYLGLGLALRPLGVTLDDPETARALGYAALVVILAEGGLTTPWSSFRPAAAPAVALATVGVAVSALVTAVAAFALLGGDWRLALLAGTVVASTDSAAVFSVLRRVPLPRRLAGVLEAESGINDAPVVILVVALSTAPTDDLEPLPLLGRLVYELAVGAVVGIALGQLGAAAVRRIALPASGLYPLAVLAYAAAAYGVASGLHASGFLAVYLAALVLGNARLPHGPPVRAFAEGLAWLAQIGLFVLLGLLVKPSELTAALVPALGIGFVLLLVARPLSVLISLAPFRFPWREQAYLSWAGLRGAVPIVLATVPVVEEVPGGDRLFHIVFLLVVVFTVLQAPTLARVAIRLGISAPVEPRDIDVESSPLLRLGADLLELHIPPYSRLHGVEVVELRLPPGAAVTLVVREGRAFVPAPTTALRHGDDVLVVTTAEAREAAERRLRAISRAGRLAGWYGEPG